MSFDAPWDDPARDPFPVLRRFSAASPSTLERLPEALGAHPFAPIVEAHPDPVLAHGACTPVTLDPGTDLAEWQQVRWHIETGPVRVTTSGIRDEGTIPLQTLSDFAARWAEPRPDDFDETVIDVDPRLIRRVGRGGALIDAQLVDSQVDVGEYQVVYDGGDPAGFVASEAQRLHKRPFARLTKLPPTVAERAARGQPISARNRDRALKALLNLSSTERTCALDGCDVLIERPNASYCSKAHRDRAYRMRLRDKTKPVSGPPVCAGCGAVLIGPAALRACPICSTPNTPTRKEEPK